MLYKLESGTIKNCKEVDELIQHSSITSAVWSDLRKEDQESRISLNKTKIVQIWTKFFSSGRNKADHIF